MVVTIREPSEAGITKPIAVESLVGKVDPEFEVSKEYPTVGYLTKPINLTVTVIAPMTISDQFEFWGTYGSFIGIFAGGFIGAFAKVLFDRRKKKIRMFQNRILFLYSILLQTNLLKNQSSSLLFDN